MIKTNSLPPLPPCEYRSRFLRWQSIAWGLDVWDENVGGGSGSMADKAVATRRWCLGIPPAFFKTQGKEHIPISIKNKLFMIFENLQPRIDEAIEIADKTKEPQEVKLIYNEISYRGAMNPAFEYLFTNSRPFTTRYDEFRFVLIIHPKN